MPVSLWLTAEPSDVQTRRIWLLQSGSMAVFAVVVKLDQAHRKRRYLFTVTANEALFEILVAEQCPYRILAIALEEPVLKELKPHQWDLDDGETLATVAIGWQQHLASVFPNAPTSIQSLHHEIEKGESDLPSALDALHANFFEQLQQLEQQEFDQTLDRFWQREELNDRAAEGAFQGLVNAIQAQPLEWHSEDLGLLAAAGAVGKHLGIDIQAPAVTEEWETLADAITAIAQASRLRVRRITLAADWWHQDYGPLLGYLQADESPVALLPLRPGQYVLYEPTANAYIPVGDRESELLSPVAYTFYRALPDHALSTWDVVKFALRGQTKGLLTLLWVGIAATLAGMFTPFALGFLIDQAIPDANQKVLFQVGLGLLAASLGVAVFQFAQRQLLLRFQTTTDLTTQAAIWDRLLKLKLSFFRQYSTGDLKNRVTAMGQIRARLGGATLPVLFTSLFALLNLLLLFFYSANLAWIAVIVAGVALLVNNAIRLLASQKFRTLQALEGDLFGALVQMIGGISKLRVAGAENRAFAYWAAQYRQQLQLIVSTQQLEDWLAVFNTMLPTLSSLVFFWFAIALINRPQGSTGSLSTGSFLAFNTAFGIFIAGATNLSETLINVLQAGILWERTRPILQAELEVDASKAHPGKLSGHLKLDRVTFRYRTDGPLILEQITLQATPGEFIALVGPSGSGKSTIIRLMLGFESPQQGTIYYDSQDLSELDITAVRRQLGVVLQNGRITSASLFENIAAGALITLDEAWEAAKLAGFSEDIDAMPMGMHTVISEGGSNLSGGQRQRLLIARALVLKPKILILDEATSALDNRTQEIISHHLEQMQVTRVAIAHRLSTIRHADRIYVLEQGRVVQQGTFDQLVDQPGLFQRMMNRQMA
ncbi:MAG: NHLP bacteriocin export ABC transporter permease/ATPase subunit [Leptolyngbya sp. SIO1D8]|nr:NHLP bacteriocin export ABC transporter permease/ATPase subunit [Leptolyngbya sp. SIO1D8]